MNIRDIKGIGEKTAAVLEKLNIRDTADMLSYFPRDYEVFKAVCPVSGIVPGEINAVRGIIKGSISLRYLKGLSLITFKVADASGEMQASIFNEPYMKKNLRQGTFYVFRGLVKKKGSGYVIEQPHCYKPEEYEKLVDVMQPIYRVTKGISSKSVEKYIKRSFDIEQKMTDDISKYPKGSVLDEFLPEDIIAERSLCSHAEAVRNIHFPKDLVSAEDARKRLVYEEFLIFIISIKRYKDEASEVLSSYPMIAVSDTERLLDELPYRLTDDQMKTWRDIESDMSGKYCMNRLIQGDVGSGKTIIAILALLMTAANGHQGSMMAPTEVLAEQHFKLISDMTEKYSLPLRPVLLTGSVPAKEKREIYEGMKDGSYNVIIGTHALIQEKAVYKDLALAVTDEQHRFGVRQRVDLSEKGGSPHIMVMSATPIPRTLAMILYGDLKISVIKQMPVGRKPIKNAVVGPDYRERLYKMIIEQVSKGHQVYVICPMIGDEEQESDTAAGLENVRDYSAKLSEILPETITIASLSGNMKPNEKNRIMEEFTSGDIDVLVSTTVIEVGVNVPNASMMIIENADRFGLAQLHQLRGRVGRGSEQSFCVFVNSSQSPDAAERLKILTETNDGFLIASEDMKKRGPGDIFGIRQSGDMSFKMGDIYQDSDILEIADKDASMIFGDDKELKKEKNRKLLNVIERNEERSMDMRSI